MFTRKPKKGQPCSRKTVDGEDFCSQHAKTMSVQSQSMGTEPIQKLQKLQLPKKESSSELNRIIRSSSTESDDSDSLNI